VIPFQYLVDVYNWITVHITRVCGHAVLYFKNLASTQHVNNLATATNQLQLPQ
jgi:hypothetical protein